jgi:hypothetical protein
VGVVRGGWKQEKSAYSVEVPLQCGCAHNIEQHGAGTVSSVLNLMLDRLNVMESKDNLEPKKSVSTSVTLDTKCSSITGTQPSIAQANNSNSVNPPSLTSTSVPPPVSWATTASANNEGWKEVSRKTKVAVKVKGIRSDLSVKAVPRKEIVAAFVGRLNLDTEENDLRDFLTSAGLNDVKCKKLKVKDGQKFKFNTAAFLFHVVLTVKNFFMMVHLGLKVLKSEIGFFTIVINDCNYKCVWWYQVRHF